MLFDPINVNEILSAAERELYEMQFTLISQQRRTNELNKLETIQLFHEYGSEVTPKELKMILDHFEGRGAFQFNVNEYIQIKASKKIELEAADEEDLKRHFTVLDYHGNGSLVATEITEALEKTGDPGVNVLKEAIQNATKLSQDGFITFQLFRQAIHDMNRQYQSSIASSTMRLYRLKSKLQETSRVKSKTQQSSLQTEYDVLAAQTHRQKTELITMQNDLFAKVYNIIVAQYMCETRVLNAFEILFDLLHTEDSHLFRFHLEKSGRMVHVHPSFLLQPSREIIESNEFIKLCDFIIPEVIYDMDQYGFIYTNRIYRKIFLSYCLLGSPTNLQTISRMNFLRFAKDCRLVQLKQLLDAEIDTCYVIATRDIPIDSRPIPQSGMNFKQWVHGTTLLLCKYLGYDEMPNAETQDELFRQYIIPHAHQLQTQPLGPEVSQPQVMQFILKHVWPLKQLFSHFAGHSMTTIELHRGLSLRNFILFVRCFEILPSSLIDQPVTKPSFRQLSLQEVVQEYNAAKLDVGFAKAESRESLDLNFHEFLRCIQRLALAMNRSTPGKAHGSISHLSLVSSFQHYRNDMETPGQAQVHLFKHTRQLHVQDRQMSKIATMVRARLTSDAGTNQLPFELPHGASSFFDRLPPLAMENVVSPSYLPSKPPVIQSTTKKCTQPRPTHLPIAMSPRYSSERPFSLGGSPRVKTIRVAPQLNPPPTLISPCKPPSNTSYQIYTIQPMSSRERSRTPYEPVVGVINSHVNQSNYPL